MHSKTIIVSCGDAVTPERAATLFSSMDADVRALKVPPNQALDAMRGASFDMLLIDDSDGSCDLAEVEAALSRGGSTTALFVVMKGDRAASVRLPVQIPFDFACEYASDDEVKVRCRRLLWPGEMTSDADFVHVSGQSCRGAGRSYVYGVCAARVFGNASGPDLFTRGSAFAGVGLRLLRRNAHGGCAYPSSEGEARP